ncbi:M-phase inducer phosphatase-like isoform X2 [Pseudomyrmex gracilis]|uniref:M-phase inducer phosphatase-like isoform X2 n=1 Tax=Pseudomyrmex gracilis TaxID=219809 RepID=UPI000994E7DD|nr:M-phase inducer phosphatase-like isoform X2 [Pseudomyrmex gracilis]
MNILHDDIEMSKVVMDTSSNSGNFTKFMHIRFSHIAKTGTTYPLLVDENYRVISPNKHDGFRIEEHEKENGGATNLYKSTPQKICCNNNVRYPLENCDVICNRQEKQHQFHAAVVVGTPASRRTLNPQYSPMIRSPLSVTSQTMTGQRSSVGSTFLRSLSSGYESMDDGLLSELVDIDTMDYETQLPSDISKLLSGNIVAPETSANDFDDVSMSPQFSRSLTEGKPWVTNYMRERFDNCKQKEISISPSPSESSLSSSSPSLSRIRTCLFRSPSTDCSTRVRQYRLRKSPAEHLDYYFHSPANSRSSKRSNESPKDDASIYKKRSRKCNSFCDTTPKSSNTRILARTKIPLQRSLSETEAHAIKRAVHRSATDSDLTGDFSKPCVLPIIIGHHPDLKIISPSTLAALLRGEFGDRIASYQIIDCRYPYEYQGGHIEGALNLYNTELITEKLLDPITAVVPQILDDTDKRNILVFHCEFSRERGPNLSRVLRRLDRERNKDHYPALHYPEIYLLHGGYKKFYNEQKEFCSPQDYKSMKDPEHADEFKFFRGIYKSKSWMGEQKSKASLPTRPNLKRLGF